MPFLKLLKGELLIWREAWLANQDSYSLHKAARKRFKRIKVIVSEVDAQWQADLVDMKQSSKHNSSAT